jgi:hypothetical protein
LDRLDSKARRVRSRLWSLFQTFVVMNSSSRGIDDAAMAVPVSASLR